MVAKNIYILNNKEILLKVNEYNEISLNTIFKIKIYIYWVVRKEISLILYIFYENEYIF